MALYHEVGVVLRTYKLGEADRIVVLASRERGKVRAVAKGVRKTKSRFGARLEPTSHVSLQLYEGRNLDTITQVEALDRLHHLRDDYDRFTKASAMLEAVDQVMQEGERDPSLYHLLLGALRALDAQNSALVLPAFFLKLLAHEGLTPVVDECVACGADDDLVAFDLVEGGVLCRSCRRGTSLSPAALELVRAILGGRLGAALNEPRSPSTREVEHLATGALEHHLERRLRSVGLLEE